MKLNKTQIGLLIGVILLSTILYFLPKKVLTNPKEGANRDKPQQGESDGAASSANLKAIPLILTESVSELAESEKKALVLEENADAKTIQKVMEAYTKIDNRIGVAYCMEQLKDSYSAKDLGLAYYEAFKQSLVTENKQALAAKVLSYLKPVLEKSPDNEIKCAIADCYVNTAENPMTGITLLREVIAADSINENALFLLGEFAIKSGQLDKATTRFESLVRHYPSNIKYYVYLAQLFSGQGNHSKAVETLTSAKKFATRKSAIDSINTSINHLK